jgi:hypothetical protein
MATEQRERDLSFRIPVLNVVKGFRDCTVGTFKLVAFLLESVNTE